MVTKTISARVPVKFHEEFTNWAKANDTTVSAQMQRMFEVVSTDTFFPDVDSVKVDKETRGTLLSLGGGSTVALLVYKGLIALLTDKYPLKDPNELKMYAIAGASTVGLLSGIGIHKLMNL